MRNMAEGSIYRHLLAYSVPLIFGNILQLTYNVVDAALVSKGVGIAALSAVSVSDPVATLLVQGISGIGIGASVHMSRYYGAGDMEKLKRALSTTQLFGSAASILLLAPGLLLANPILRALHVPGDILSSAVLYLRLLFVGSFFTFQYNILSGALRAVGDSRSPVLFVALSSLLNAALDVLFIFPLSLGVFGAALATVISEAVSALLCFIYVYRHVPALRLRRGEFRLDHAMLRRILSSGMLTALQQSCQPIGKLLIQSVVNTQGISVIAAFNAAAKIDDYGRIPAQTISHGMMTCTAQNRGAGKLSRTQETLRKGLLLGLLYYPIAASLILLFRAPLMRIFVPKSGGEEMFRIGVSYLSVKALLLFYPCLTNGMQGYFRGMNRMTVTLLSTLLQISVRTLFVYLLVPRLGINGEAYACAAGWTVMLLFAYGCYRSQRVPAVHKIIDVY
ncbi:MAG: MATE family efflux transporter [Oribacterium sp.]